MITINGDLDTYTDPVVSINGDQYGVLTNVEVDYGTFMTQGFTDFGVFPMTDRPITLTLEIQLSHITSETLKSKIITPVMDERRLDVDL